MEGKEGSWTGSPGVGTVVSGRGGVAQEEGVEEGICWSREEMGVRWEKEE